MESRSDEELLAATTRGDASAFGAFYRRHAAPLTGFFAARTRNAEQAADLTAETFAAALEGCRRFRPEMGSAAGWLYGIAHHKLAQLARRGAVDQRARRKLGMPRIELTDDQLERIDELGRSAPSLDALPAEQRTAVHGRVVQERSYADLAATEGVTEAVIRQRVSRGLAALRARVQKETP